MPTTPQSLVVDPQGVAYAINITDINGGAVTAYTTRDGASAFVFPATISTETTFYFTSGTQGHERNATPYIVSAKFLTVECAGPDSSTVVVYAQNWQPGKLTIELGNGAEELANLLSNAGGGGGSGGNVLRTTSGTPDNSVGNDGDYAIDPATDLLYGPKASGVWPAGVSLKGADGATGATGAPGADGAAGSAGAAATVAAGSTTTGVAGSSASVTNSGSSSAAVFDFTIPRGDTGATGAAGSNGSNGSNGATGATGAVGTPSGTAATFTWDTATGNSNPGSGKIRANNATTNIASTLYVNNADLNGVDVSAAFAAGLSNSARFILRHETDPTKYIQGSAFYSGSSGAFFAIGVTANASSASSPFIAGDRVVLTMVANGDAGAAGAAGPAGTGFFGDGNEGSLSLTQTSSAPAYATKSGSGATTTFLLTRDVYATDFHFDASNGNFIVSTGGFRIFANGTLTIDSGVTIDWSGKNGSGATAGTALAGNTIGQNVVGVGSIGATNTTATQATAVASSASSTNNTATIHGGNGGGTSAGTGNGVGGGAASNAFAFGSPRNFLQALSGMVMGATTKFAGGGGGTGGSATGGTTATGGGGGSGGGLVGIYAKTLVHNGAINAKGGTGGNAAVGNGTAAGGGGGGGGGAILIVCGTKSGSGTLSVAGGTGGALAGSGGTGGTGQSGITYVHQLSV